MFKGQRNVLDKISEFKKGGQTEIDFNIVQYKSVPWDIRFNDMFLYLFIRDFIEYKTDSDNKNVRLKITEFGMIFFSQIKDVFRIRNKFSRAIWKPFSRRKNHKYNHGSYSKFILETKCRD